MEERKGFFKKYGYLFSLVSFLGAFLFLIGTVITVETKYYVGEEKIKEYFNLNFVNLLNSNITKPFVMIIILVLIGVGFILILLAGLLQKKIKEQLFNGLIAGSIFSALVGICFIFSSKEIFVYFASNENPLIENFNDASLNWGAAVSIIFLALAINYDISFSSYAEQNNVKVMAENGLLIAMAFVLNFVKLPITTTGGSINLQMIPLMIIALRRGPLHGFVCGGLIYGLLTCLTDGYGFATYPFDYLVGFGSVAIMGFFRSFILSEEQTNYNIKGELFILLGGILATAVRFFGSTLSSVIIYDYEFVPALVYNAVYIPVSGAISVAVIMAMYGPLIKLNQRFPTQRAVLNK